MLAFPQDVGPPLVASRLAGAWANLWCAMGSGEIKSWVDEPLKRSQLEKGKFIPINSFLSLSENPLTSSLQPSSPVTYSHVTHWEVTEMWQGKCALTP